MDSAPLLPRKDEEEPGRANGLVSIHGSEFVWVASARSNCSIFPLRIFRYTFSRGRSLSIRCTTRLSRCCTRPDKRRITCTLSDYELLKAKECLMCPINRRVSVSRRDLLAYTSCHSFVKRYDNLRRTVETRKQLLRIFS